MTDFVTATPMTVTTAATIATVEVTHAVKIWVELVSQELGTPSYTPEPLYVQPRLLIMWLSIDIVLLAAEIIHPRGLVASSPCFNDKPEGVCKFFLRYLRLACSDFLVLRMKRRGESILR